MKSSDADKQVLFEKAVNKFEKLLVRYLYFMKAYNNDIVINKLHKLYKSYAMLISSHYDQFYNNSNTYAIIGSQDDILFKLIYYYYEAVSNLHKFLKFFGLPDLKDC